MRRANPICHPCGTPAAGPDGEGQSRQSRGNLPQQVRALPGEASPRLLTGGGRRPDAGRVAAVAGAGSAGRAERHGARRRQAWGQGQAGSQVVRESVRPGQRYRAKKAWSHEWLVEAVVRDREGHPHAKLRSVNDRNEIRTFACSVLLDRTRFELVADAAPDPAPGLRIR